MTFEINDHLLSKECDELARDIFDEVMSGANGETAEDMRDTMDERAHEAADGHEWVIYNHKALMLCAHCNTEQGEGLLADVGVQEPSDIYKLACVIAFGEMRGRIMDEIERLIEEWEPEEEADDADEADA